MIHVIMFNDYPSRVYEDQALAEEHVRRFHRPDKGHFVRIYTFAVAIEVPTPS